MEEIEVKTLLLKRLGGLLLNLGGVAHGRFTWIFAEVS
jgi:hypothetical protein